MSRKPKPNNWMPTERQAAKAMARNKALIEASPRGTPGHKPSDYSIRTPKPPRR